MPSLMAAPGYSTVFLWPPKQRSDTRQRLLNSHRMPVSLSVGRSPFSDALGSIQARGPKMLVRPAAALTAAQPVQRILQTLTKH
jgi:hypothetical protein